MALRTPLSVTPHLYMGDSTGRPLDKGVVYFGEQDKDPEFYPINLFSDDALTKPLAQPVHTKGGYLYDKGDMVEPHAKELIYSVKVLDSYGRKVFYKGAMMRNSWNDDVIEQINTAIIGSADAARQVAIDITNDAINNTAVEGGVLADTFVVVDGSLSQRTINKGLESIADLSTINNPKDGLRVYVKSYHAGLGKGGGYFTYDSTKVSINDGGIVINGWVRQLDTNALDVTMFGAKGDGQTDDSNAIQSTIDFATANNVPTVILPKSTYQINSVIHVKDNVAIDGKDSLVRCGVSTPYAGAFQARGSVLGSFYYLSKDLIDGDLTITRSNAQNEFSAGEFVFVSQIEPSSSELVDNHKKKHTSQLLKIKSVSGDVITLTEPIVHSYYVSDDAKIQKAIPIKNASVSNLTVDHLGTVEAVHTVYLHTTVHCSVDNIKSRNSAGNGIQVIRSRYFDVESIEVCNRTDVLAGKGYCVGIGSSSFGNINKIYSYACRHAVDIAGGSHSINVTNSFGMADATASFAAHGQNVRKVAYTNCHVLGSVEGFHFGNTSFKFDYEITVTNCTATKCTIGFLAGVGSYSIIFEGCSAYQCRRSFSITDVYDVSLNNCHSKDTADVVIWIVNSKQVNISNFTSSGSNLKGVEIAGKSHSVNITNLHLKGVFSGYPLFLSDCSVVNITSLIYEAATSESAVTIINSNDISLSSAKLIGSADKCAIDVTVNSAYISLSDITVKTEVGLDAIRLGSNMDDTSREVHINGGFIIANGEHIDKKVIRSYIKDLSVVNTAITGDIISNGTSGVALIGSPRLDGHVNIAAQKNVIISNNMGKYILTPDVPEHNGTTVVIANNVLTTP